MNIRIILFLIFIIYKPINAGIVKEIDDNLLEYNNIDYINAYKIPNSIMSFKSNGSSKPRQDLSFAFDDNFKTYWVSLKYQESSFLNNIVISFENTVFIDRMVYQAPSFLQVKGDGYPNELKVYYKLKKPDGTLSDDESDFLLADDIISERTGNKVLFIFDQEIVCDQIKLEWVEIDNGISNFQYASASEIILLLTENEYINNLLFNIFNDYSQLSIVSEYNDINIIEDIEEKIRDYLDISEYLSNYLNKIKNIINGKIGYEPRREFTTNKSAKMNIINQYGDVASYSTTILKMANGGTNKQPTGIYGFSNEIITVYVEANIDDPLPFIRFSQYIGHKNWISSTIELKKGKNIFKIQEFNLSDIEVKLKSGGPIYIENKYTSNEQSQNIKIYIEGGILFPLFRLNDNEDEFKQILNNYIIMYNKNIDTYYNIVELYSNSVTITVNATDAYEVYNVQGESPQQNLLNWDEVVKKLYIFDGIQFEEHQPYYDIKNNLINLHIRYSARYKTNVVAYAANEYIGIFLSETFYNALVSYIQIGKTLAHEIGHMIDVKGRTYAERTNVVLEEYAVQALYKHIYNRKNCEFLHTAIAPDNIDNLNRNCHSEVCKGFFINSGDYTYTHYVWWAIESFYPGYWGKLDNLYRYNISLIKGMNKNEQMVYLTSLIIGFDTGYYFERFGLAMDNNIPFTISSTSKIYNESMEDAINQGKVKTNIFRKLWYADSDQYNYTLNNGTGCYNNENDFNVEIIRIYKDNEGDYKITLSSIDCIGHLGFEIIENDTVIGFTTKYYFYDMSKHPDDYRPIYKVVAYDRLLNYKESNYKRY